MQDGYMNLLVLVLIVLTSVVSVIAGIQYERQRVKGNIIRSIKTAGLQTGLKKKEQ